MYLVLAKNKVFAGTGSLPNQIAMAVGINSYGIDVFFLRLFKKTGTPVTNNLAFYLKTKEKHQMKRLDTIWTRAAELKKKNVSMTS